MNPLLVGHNDGPSGAGRAVARLHSGLLEEGVPSRLLVGHGTANIAETFPPRGPLTRLTTKLRGYADQAPLKFYRNRRRGFFSTTFCAGDPSSNVRGAGTYDLIHLHWVNGGFVHPAAFARFGKPIVWSIHDSWAFTGGCHVPGDCARYTQSCGSCPQLGSRSNFDLSRMIWNRKFRAWRNLSMNLVTPSHWMADCIRKSRLLGDREVHVIPNGIDTRIYRPFPKKAARERLGLPIEGRLVLFGAINATADRNKGYDLLNEAMEHLALTSKKAEGRRTSADRTAGISLVVFGTERDPRVTKNWHTSGFPLYQLGSFADDLALALVYSAADVMCVPSRQESFGQTAAEALACGTPTVAFGATGLLDIIDHKKNGYLARPYDTLDFAAGINWVLGKSGRSSKIAAATRKKIETNFRLDRVTRRHIELYESLLL